MSRVRTGAVALVLCLAPAMPAHARPYDHQCSGPVDYSCRIGWFRKCDYYLHDVSDAGGGAQYCVRILTAVTVDGTGLISPGLSLTGAISNVRYDMSLRAVFPYGDEVTSTNCTYTATSVTAETVSFGVGEGNFECADSGISGSVGYTRQFSEMSLDGSFTYDGTTYVIGHGVLNLVYQSVNPITSFATQGTIEAQDPTATP